MTNRLYVNEPVAASAPTTESTTPPAAFTASAEGTAPDAKRPVFAEGTQPQPKLEPEPIARGSHMAIPAPARPATVTQTAPVARPAAAPAPAVKPEGTTPEAPAFRAPPELATRATHLGELWSQECVRDLRAQHREIVGGWPGTLREARRRVLAAMPRTLDPQHLEELAKITNLAARKGWESVSEPDLEP